MNYKDIMKDIKDEIPPVRFFNGERYRAGFSGYTKREVDGVMIRVILRTGCKQKDLKPHKDSDGLYTLYYHESVMRG